MELVFIAVVAVGAELATKGLPLLGGLVAGFTQVLGYFFGSSKSSSDKTKLLALPGK